MLKLSDRETGAISEEGFVIVHRIGQSLAYTWQAIFGRRLSETGTDIGTLP